MFNVGRHFKAPKKSDNAQWKKVGFLIAHGFLFQKIRPNPNSYESVPYPDTLEEAKEFVVKYKDWALTNEMNLSAVVDKIRQEHGCSGI
jgi:hypothetical protein